MCGIAGIVSQRPSGDLSALKRMADSLAHRGPDGEGFWQSADRRVALAHRRLAILDTSDAGTQPLLSDDGRWALVFNGEIYNFLELRSELESKGHRFHTQTDSEVLLNGWQRWGWDLLPKMNGMWAFAICDTDSGALFLARDRFGVKPLVYAETSDGFYFASEPKALLTLPEIPRSFEPQALQRAVFDPFSFESSDRDLFSAVRKLPAGHRAEYRDGRLTVTRYWHTLDHLVAPPKTLDEAGEAFRALFDDSVRIRMRSDVRIGTCLSGGFDSTAVACTMAAITAGAGNQERGADDWRHAIVASFPGLSNDETASARVAAKAAGIAPTILDFSSDQGTDFLDESLAALDSIYISLPTAIWKTYRAVDAEGVKVTLDGHGADEAFGGYRNNGNQSIFLLRSLLSTDVGRSASGRRISDNVRRLWFSQKGGYFLRKKPLMELDRFDNPFVGDAVPGDWSLLDRRLYGMFHIDILPTLLRNYDRLSMAHGVEIRMPFMDWRLVTFIMSLPHQFKADYELTKLAARVGMKGRIPDEIRLSPRKVGFSSQMPDWMNGSLGQWAKKQLANPHPAMEELFDTKGLVAQIAHLNDRKLWTWSLSDRLWPYINLDWYLKKHAG
ncbi:MAG: asparagine synthase (glutamine-hydrolyzing) [Sphingopyxis sp.]|nr:asparagine synthase (glutamine-hydrolyzing) [Sphingopyxis sp.]